MNTLKRQISPSLVISVLALSVALGASGAIALPGSGKVDSNDLRPNTVASKHIKPNAVQPRDIDEGKLYIGVEVGDTGAVAESTIPGVSASGFAGDQTTVTFPRDVTKCIPVASAIFGGNVLTQQSGTAPANRNKVTVSNDGVAKSFNLILVCG